MNEFCLFEQLCLAESIANQYSYGIEYGKKLRELADKISTRIYRVAVIGEFKRGKSSLINALIGSSVLPTDILPMTAAITNVKYGEEKKITIEYKSGKTEEKSIEELIDYATKYDKAKEKTAGQVQNITVRYPSVLCKNNIEIIDTPGMNDDEKMSEITLGVLNDIDTAIMVISACSPLSITEQDLIIRMIKEPGIRHIVFVVTYIDAVADDEEEQDEIIAYISKRITKDLFKRAQREFADSEALLNKSEKILSSPDVFGVSSVLAVEGFVEDNSKKLKLSRLPFLKQQLLEILTAAQSLDSKEKTSEAICYVESEINTWFEKEQKDLQEKKDSLLKTENNFKEYFECSDGITEDILKKFDSDFSDYAFLSDSSFLSEQLTKKIKKIFIQNLCTIRENTNTHKNIYDKLVKSFDEADLLIKDINESAKSNIFSSFEKLYSDYSRLRPEISDNIQEKDLRLSLLDKIESFRLKNSLPEFTLERGILRIPVMNGVNIIDNVGFIINAAISDYKNNMQKYSEKLKNLYKSYHSAAKRNNNILSIIRDEADDIDRRINAMQFNINNDIMRIQNAKQILKEND